VDVADADKSATEDEPYPTLADITLKGVSAVRSLITNLGMDVLLYQSGYREYIADIVQKECNRIYKLFKDHNPKFRGSVSLCGHSLGSAIMFDILCCQPDNSMPPGYSGHLFKSPLKRTREVGDNLLGFNCDNFFCLGSPIALFQMLNGRIIAGRKIGGIICCAKSYGSQRC
jgi:DDHD domain